jgi:tRNA dimethylallyltransferase
MADTPIPLLCLLGATAAGKTRLAALIAASADGEVISADSRQVYRDMDIGTGKDMEDYVVDGHTVPKHLIDIVDPGYE